MPTTPLSATFLCPEGIIDYRFTLTINIKIMKKQFYYLGYTLIAVSLLSITSCKKDTPAAPEQPQTAVSGVYILNEGDWTGDNASLSYFDLETNEMKNDVFYEVNSETVLGELANDMGIYGSKLFITVTGSNKVE